MHYIIHSKIKETGEMEYILLLLYLARDNMNVYEMKNRKEERKMTGKRNNIA